MEEGRMIRVERTEGNIHNKLGGERGGIKEERE